MENHLESLPFDEWVAHVFDHPVRSPEWYFELDAPVWAAPATLTLSHMTRLFNDPVGALSPYDDRQLNQGFWYLVSNGGSNHMFALTDESAPLQVRVQCVESFLQLFQKLFATRCSPHLSHLDRTESHGNPLNLACYMWWDIIPFIGAPRDPARKTLDSAALAVMEAILSIDSIACRESALHGLGHWHSGYPDQIGGIIDRALKDAQAWPSELTAYAQSARCGCVL